MNYIDKLNEISRIKEDIRVAINNKGTVLNPEQPFSDYPASIDNIKLGGAPRIECNKTNTMHNGSWLNQIKSIDWTDFNSFKIKNMSYMFEEWRGLNIPLSNLATTGVTKMDYMFKNCINLQSLNLKNFNTSSAVSMEGMFKGCARITNLDLSSFDTSKVRNVKNMFEGFGAPYTALPEGPGIKPKMDPTQKKINITFGKNWLSNSSIIEFDFVGGGFSGPANFSKETILDLIDKLAVRSNKPVLKISNYCYQECKAEIEAAMNKETKLLKGWEIQPILDVTENKEAK